MKKIYAIIAGLCCFMAAEAQQFCDGQGNPIASGSTLNMPYEAEEEQAPLVNFGVLNNTDASADIAVTVDVKSKPYGTFMCCVGTTCTTVELGNPNTYTFKKVAAGSFVQWVNTEYDPTNDAGEPDPSAICSVEFSMSNGQKVTINFGGSATAVNTVKSNKTSAQVYNLLGQQVDANAKGLLIVGGKKVVRK